MASKKIVKKSAARKSVKAKVAKVADVFLGQYVIIRGYDTGVFFGKLVSRRDAGPGRQEVVLADGRRIWEWYGPETLSGVASVGVNNANSKVESAPEGKLAMVSDATEILICTDVAIASIKAARFAR